jgi:hypothetical protein
MQQSARSISRPRPWPPWCYIPSEKLLADLRRVAAHIGKRRMSQTDYSQFGRYSTITISRRFKSWRLAMEKIDLHPAYYRNVDAETLLRDIRKVAAAFKTRHLLQSQYLQHGLYARKIICRLFGGWQYAAVAAGLIPVHHQKRRQRREVRIINVVLRYQILRRDRFRCRACGRSHATNPEVQLQVDHIIPWSQGGSSRVENLQTLCNRCNRGKADSV